MSPRAIRLILTTWITTAIAIGITAGKIAMHFPEIPIDSVNVGLAAACLWLVLPIAVLLLRKQG